MPLSCKTRGFQGVFAILLAWLRGVHPAAEEHRPSGRRLEVVGPCRTTPR
jgi:hypothetical protein